MKKSLITVAAALMLLTACTGFSRAGDGLEMISVAELREKLSARETTIIDVRDPGSWESSTEKIPGAVRQDPQAVPMWMAKYGKSEPLVVYCA